MPATTRAQPGPPCATWPCGTAARHGATVSARSASSIHALSVPRVAGRLQRRRVAGERGQSTVEWVALVARRLAGASRHSGAAAGAGFPGAALANAIAARRLRCRDGGRLRRRRCPTELVAAYGPGLARRGRTRAPQIRYEPGMRALPVDYRRCREDACAEGADAARSRERAGEPVTLFSHVIDCRPAPTRRARHVCAGRAPAISTSSTGSITRAAPPARGRRRRGAIRARRARQAHPPRRLGVVPVADRRRRRDVTGQLPSRLQPRRRRRQLGLDAGWVTAPAGARAAATASPAAATPAPSRPRGEPRGPRATPAPGPARADRRRRRRPLRVRGHPAVAKARLPRPRVRGTD